MRRPTAEHWLGTDQFGRDVLTRIIYGARTSLVLGLLSPALAAVIGTVLGLAGGYFGGWPDRLLGRVVDLLLAFPALLLGILVAAALSSGFWSMVAVLTIAFAPRFARIARASTLSLRHEPFVEAAVAAGVSHARIILRHILPNIAGPVVVRADLVDRDRDPAGGDVELPRHGHPAAAGELGQHHPRRPQQHVRLGLADHRRRRGHQHHRAGIQHDRRRGA